MTLELMNEGLRWVVTTDYSSISLATTSYLLPARFVALSPNLYLSMMAPVLIFSSIFSKRRCQAGTRSQFCKNTQCPSRTA